MTSLDEPDRASWPARLAERRIGLWVVAAVVSLLLAGPASRLELDESIESFYSEDDPYLRAYLASKGTFGGDEFVMVAYPADDPTSESELRRIRAFAEKLSSVPGIRAESTQDLASTLRNPRASGIVRVAMRLPATERSLVAMSRRVLIGDDDQTVAIVLRLDDESRSSIPRKETYRRIRELAAAHDPPARVAGEPVQIHDMFRYVERDGWVLGTATSLLLMAVILLLFRNLRWVVLPIAVIQMTLLWTKGLLYLSGLKLSMVSSMLTSLITIIGIATVMHVTVTYRQQRMTLSRYEAYLRTFELLARPIFWTCLTTAIGFFALLSSSIVPVRSFGIMVAVGTLLVPVVCLLLLPGGILIGKPLADPRTPVGEAALVAFLTRLGRWCCRHPRGILAVSLLLTVAAGWGLMRLQVETDFSRNFRSDSPIVQALNYFEEKLGGVGSWEIGFTVPGLDEATLDDVAAVADKLRDLQLEDGTQLTKVIAITDGYNLITKVPLGEGERRGGLLRMLPRFRTPSLEERKELLQEMQPELQPSLYHEQTGRMRIVLRSLERQPAEVKLALIDRVEETVRETFPDARSTGLYVLLAYLISSLLADQVVSFCLASLGVGLAMTIAFRSVRLGLISLVPNILPILLVIGGMGWFQLPINIGTAMIASVSMGLTVDSTIHYLTAYRRKRDTGADHQSSVEFAHAGVGLALTLANLALIAGFSVLTLSHFVPLIYFGVLVSVAMLGGLVCNLVLLPVLIGWGDGGLRQEPAASLSES